MASRAVTGFPPTSTIGTRPRESTCDSCAFALPGLPGLPASPALPALDLLTVPSREIEREAFERHREVDALQLHISRHLQRPGRKIQDGLDPRRDDKIDDALR